MFITLVSVSSCLLCLFPRAWSLDLESTCKVSQSLIDKHILVDNRSVPKIPFQDIVDRFSVSQRTRNFKSKKRTQHLFITTQNQSSTVYDLEKAYCDKVEQRASKSPNSNSNFFVYEINFKELRTLPVEAIDLQITRGTDPGYTIKDCKHSDSGTFNLGAKLIWDENEKKVLSYEINHVDNVQLRGSVKCMTFTQRLPAGTCPT